MLDVCESTCVLELWSPNVTVVVVEREQAFAAVSALDELGTRDVWTVS